MTTVIRAYKLQPPGGPPFHAAVVQLGEGVAVVTDRSGGWQRDDSLHFADLVMPEQKLSDWDVERVAVEALPSLPE
jgi:hypothetical protein